MARGNPSLFLVRKKYIKKLQISVDIGIHRCYIVIVNKGHNGISERTVTNMKRQEIEKIIEQNKRKRTETLESFIRSMKGIIECRDQSKGMWFWRENGNGKERARREKQLAEDIVVDMKGLGIVYWRRVSMSRQNVYVKEELYGIVNNEKIKITAADLKKLIEGYEAIIEKRAGKEAA